MTTPAPRPPLFTLRTLVITVIGVLIGIGTSVLTYMTGRNLPAAVLTGCAAFGGSLLAVHQLVE